eukprot:gene250-425_t
MKIHSLVLSVSMIGVNALRTDSAQDNIKSINEDSVHEYFDANELELNSSSDLQPDSEVIEMPSMQGSVIDNENFNALDLSDLNCYLNPDNVVSQNDTICTGVTNVGKVQFTDGNPTITGPECSVLSDNSSSEPNSPTIPGDDDNKRGNYVMVEEIGSGGFATVYKCHHVDDPYELYAMKEVPVVGRRARKLAELERKTLEDLRHENIIDYRDSFFERNTCCIVMQLATGGTLRKKISNLRQLNRTNVNEGIAKTTINTRFTRAEIDNWFWQTLQGMEYLHNKDLWHRDLKPANILLMLQENGDEIVKIADFGLVKQKKDDCSASKQVALTCCGTKHYMSPEQANANEDNPYQRDCDVWALGVILYELCMLERPFKDTQQIVDPSFYVTPISHPTEDWSDLRNLCNSMLHRDPSKRPTFEELIKTVKNNKFKKFADKVWKDSLFEGEESSRYWNPFGNLSYGEFNWKALIYACDDVIGSYLGWCNNAKLVQLILDQTPLDINQADYEESLTPLHCAVGANKPEVVQLLLEREEIDVNKPKKDKSTPLWTAASKGYAGVVALLLDGKNIQVNEPNEKGETPLYIASEKGHFHVVKCLLSHVETDVNQATIDGSTPLSIALEYGKADVVELLKEHINNKMEN